MNTIKTHHDDIIGYSQSEQYREGLVILHLQRTIVLAGNRPEKGEDEGGRREGGRAGGSVKREEGRVKGV